MAVMDEIGTRQEPDEGTWAERPTQVIGQIIATHLPAQAGAVATTWVIDAVRHAVQNVDAYTWRRAWEIWAPARYSGDEPHLNHGPDLDHEGSDRTKGIR